MGELVPHFGLTAAVLKHFDSHQKDPEKGKNARPFTQAPCTSAPTRTSPPDLPVRPTHAHPPDPAAISSASSRWRPLSALCGACSEFSPCRSAAAPRTCTRRSCSPSSSTTPRSGASARTSSRQAQHLPQLLLPRHELGHHAHAIRHHIPSKKLHKRLGIASVDQYYRNRLLRWAGHVTHMPMSRITRKLLTGWVAHPRPTGSPPMTFDRTLQKALIRCRQPPDLCVRRKIGADQVEWRSVVDQTPLMPRSKPTAYAERSAKSLRAPTTAQLLRCSPPADITRRPRRRTPPRQQLQPSPQTPLPPPPVPIEVLDEASAPTDRRRTTPKTSTSRRRTRQSSVPNMNSNGSDRRRTLEAPITPTWLGTCSTSTIRE